jgi:hypothetical protein
MERCLKSNQQLTFGLALAIASIAAYAVPAPQAAPQPTPVAAALQPQAGQVAYPDFACYAGLPMTIKDTSAFFGHLTLHPGCEIYLSDAIHAQSVAGRAPVPITLSFASLELHGMATLHLEDPAPAAPSAAGLPATPRQADGKTVKGDAGKQGYGGADAKPSIELTLNIGQFDGMSDGSLWIKTDGQAGGAGGKGGSGAKGSAGPFTGTSCPNGGDGGTGGAGGTGGRGANSSRVTMTISGIVQPAEAAQQSYAPSSAPAAVLPGTHNVVIASGAPGAGGAPGGGGEGGDPGEGHGKCGWTTGHADQGNGGGRGPQGTAGTPGVVVK